MTMDEQTNPVVGNDTVVDTDTATPETEAPVAEEATEATGEATA